MANTPGGLPYPVGTDFVVNGDNAIKALAEAVEDKYGTGSRSFTAMRAGVFPDNNAYALVLTPLPAEDTIPAYTFTLGSAADLGKFTALQPGIYAYTCTVHMGEYAPDGSSINVTDPTLSVQKFYGSGGGADWLTASGHFRCTGVGPKFEVMRRTGGNQRDVNGRLVLIRLRNI